MLGYVVCVCICKSMWCVCVCNCVGCVCMWCVCVCVFSSVQLWVVRSREEDEGDTPTICPRSPRGGGDAGGQRGRSELPLILSHCTTQHGVV